MRPFTILLVSVSVHAAPSFTLEHVLSAPFPSNLVTNKHGQLAWVQNAAGVRNIWLANAPVYQSRQLTNYSADDGQEISELRLTDDGNFVVFSRGEEPNSKGESPNPRHLVSGVDQMILAIATSGGAPRELGKGHTPALSPDGKTVAFISNGQVWSTALDPTAKAVQLIHARGTVETLDWSPDGKYLAISSVRADHSFIAVYALAQNIFRFLDPSVDTDLSPVWSPDSTRIAFIRRQVDLDDLEFAPHRADAEPWSIRVADAATGAGREVWKAQPGPGSRFREISGDRQILWGAGDRLVFPWERAGWTHLYCMSLKDTGAAELTPGAFEVEHAALSDDRARVIYSSNQDDVDRRHIWEVGIAGGAPRRLTDTAGLEWEPVPIGDDTALFRSDPLQPARAAILTKAGVKDLAPQTIPQDFPAQSLAPPQPVIFSAADGLQIHGQLFLPRDGKPKHPAVIFFHGGSRRQMLLGWHYMFYYNQAYGFNQYLASRGYVVLSVNYRSGIGYGLDFREALHYGAAGASEFNDVIGAGLYLRGRNDVLPGKIGLWGGSYGGYLTALGLARASDLFAAGVDLHGVHEWNQEIQNFIPAYEPEKRQDVARLAFQSSPMAFVSTWKSPVLLIHGDDDRNVNFKQSIMLAQALRKQRVPFEELIFPDEVHDFLTHDHWLAAYHAADAFLEKYLIAQ